jgi:hypothetical protein
MNLHRRPCWRIDNGRLVVILGVARRARTMLSDEFTGDRRREVNQCGVRGELQRTLTLGTSRLDFDRNWTREIDGRRGCCEM